MSRRSKYNVAEIKGGVLEQERIEARNRKDADRREKRDRFINTSFESIHKADMNFIHKISEFRHSRNSYARETDKNMKVISKLPLTMSQESLKAGGWP